MDFLGKIKDQLPKDSKVLSIEFMPKTVGGGGKMNKQNCIVVYEFNGQQCRTILKTHKGTEKICN